MYFKAKINYNTQVPMAKIFVLIYLYRCLSSIHYNRIQTSVLANIMLFLLIKLSPFLHF